MTFAIEDGIMKSVPIEKLDQLPLLILFAINSTDSKSVNETHLQKIMFQALKILDIDPEDVGFRPHYYGPYSDMIKEYEDQLKTLGYLVEKGKKLTIRDDAVEDVSRMNLDENKAYKIQMIANNLSKLTNDELLLLIYCDDMVHNNGKYLENSTIKDTILNKRVDIAMKMYKSKKMSLERSAELANLDIRDFKDALIKRYGAVYVD